MPGPDLPADLTRPAAGNELRRTDQPTASMQAIEAALAAAGVVATTATPHGDDYWLVRDPFMQTLRAAVYDVLMGRDQGDAQ